MDRMCGTHRSQGSDQSQWNSRRLTGSRWGLEQSNGTWLELAAELG